MVRKIESTKTGGQDRPQKDVVIADSGSLPVDEPFVVPKSDATN